MSVDKSNPLYCFNVLRVLVELYPNAKVMVPYQRLVFERDGENSTQFVAGISLLDSSGETILSQPTARVVWNVRQVRVSDLQAVQQDKPITVAQQDVDIETNKPSPADGRVLVDAWENSNQARMRLVEQYINHAKSQAEAYGDPDRALHVIRQLLQHVFGVVLSWNQIYDTHREFRRYSLDNGELQYYMLELSNGKKRYVACSDLATIILWLKATERLKFVSSVERKHVMSIKSDQILLALVSSNRLAPVDVAARGCMPGVVCDYAFGLDLDWIPSAMHYDDNVSPPDGTELGEPSDTP